jgi:hypothetical protein
VIRFLNRWRQGKERFGDLNARQQALRGALETQPQQEGGQANETSASQAAQRTEQQAAEPAAQPSQEQGDG